MSSIIHLETVTKLYGDVVGVKDLTFGVEPGTIFGFLGPNGAGKTTTINMLIDLIKPTSGSIYLFGSDIKHSSLQARSRIGYVTGDMAMDPALTGRQQLEYLGRLREHYDEVYVKTLADRLDCRLDRKLRMLSRGHKQKIGLIAALMHRPDLLVLDEPTSGLDPLMQAEFNKIVLEHKSQGGTTFISSHVLSEVQELCDKVAFIRQGRLLAIRPVRALARESPKRFRVSSTDKKLQSSLRQLPGVVIESAKGSQVRGTYNGNINKLLSLVANHRLIDFALEDADLEASFMQYYESEGDGV